MKKTKLVINLFVGPNGGKTTLASEIFMRLKKEDIDVHMVSDFAAEAILEGRPDTLKYEWYVVANQMYKILCAYNAMQVVIVDSPILLGPIYDPDASPALLALCLEHHHKYNNLNIVLSRDSTIEHSMAGRVHSLTESISIDNRIVRLLDDHDIPYISLSDFGVDKIMDAIIKKVRVPNVQRTEGNGD